MDTLNRTNAMLIWLLKQRDKERKRGRERERETRILSEKHIGKTNGPRTQKCSSDMFLQPPRSVLIHIWKMPLQPRTLSSTNLEPKFCHPCITGLHRNSLALDQVTEIATIFGRKSPISAAHKKRRPSKCGSGGKRGTNVHVEKQRMTYFKLVRKHLDYARWIHCVWRPHEIL